MNYDYEQQKRGKKPEVRSFYPFKILKYYDIIFLARENQETVETQLQYLSTRD